MFCKAGAGNVLKGIRLARGSINDAHPGAPHRISVTAFREKALLLQ
jgi:hypothetical protein